MRARSGSVWNVKYDWSSENSIHLSSSRDTYILCANPSNTSGVTRHWQSQQVPSFQFAKILPLCLQSSYESRMERCAEPFSRSAPLSGTTNGHLAYICWKGKANPQQSLPCADLKLVHIVICMWLFSLLCVLPTRVRYLCNLTTKFHKFLSNSEPTFFDGPS